MDTIVLIDGFAKADLGTPPKRTSDDEDRPRYPRRTRLEAAYETTLSLFASLAWVTYRNPGFSFFIRNRLER